MYGCDADRRKEALADPEFPDLESLAEMEDPGSRRDLEILGPGLSALCLRSVAARKAWTEYYPHAESRMVWV